MLWMTVTNRHQESAYDKKYRLQYKQENIDEQVTKIANDNINKQNKIDLLERHIDPQIRNLIEHPEFSKIQNKILTIVFWDIKGFSYFCETLKEYPNLIVDFLREYFTLASDVILKHNGLLDKFMGDGVMAIFGIDGRARAKKVGVTTIEESTQGAVNALNAAIELKQGFDRIIDKWSRIWSKNVPNQIVIGLKCGINTGSVIIGNIGTENRDQFTAIGSTVNIANRLETMAEKGQIIISTTTKSAVEGHFTVNRIGITNIKNIPGEFEYFEVKDKTK